MIGFIFLRVGSTFGQFQPGTTTLRDLYLQGPHTVHFLTEKPVLLVFGLVLLAGLILNPLIMGASSIQLSRGIVLSSIEPRTETFDRNKERKEIEIRTETADINKVRDRDRNKAKD